MFAEFLLRYINSFTGDYKYLVRVQIGVFFLLCLLELFKNVDACVSDPPELVHF